MECDDHGVVSGNGVSSGRRMLYDGQTANHIVFYMASGKVAKKITNRSHRLLPSRKCSQQNKIKMTTTRETREEALFFLLLFITPYVIPS